MGSSTAGPLYTKADAGVSDAAVPDGGTRDAAAPSAAPAAPTLPSYYTLIDGKPHQIFITIDDHPGRYTESYLDLLKQHNLKATFFIVSYVLYGHLRSPTYGPALKLVDVLKRLLREGHLLGNHSVSHGLMCQMVKWRVEWEIGKSQEWVKQVLGVDLTLWRPPHGHLCPLVQRYVAKLKLVTIMWDTDDWRSMADSMVRIVKQRARRGNSSTTVLFHRDLQKLRRFLLLLPPKSP